MSKLSKAVEATQKQIKTDEERHTSETVTNFMNGESYKCSALTTLKLITASSIYGEPAYYRASGTTKNTKGEIVDDSYGMRINPLVKKYIPFDLDTLFGEEYIDERHNKITTSNLMENAIDAALSEDFKGTLDWAVTLRKEYNMRLNPQVIMVRAALHPDRQKFTQENPGLFNEINQLVMQRADEPMSQLAYYLFKNGKKNNIPSILKRSIAEKLSGLSRYQINKYKNHEIGMINAVRITHANSLSLDELMKTGTITVSENEKTWENLRSQKKPWKEIFETCDMGHMALLRNLRGVFAEVDDIEFCKKYLEKLKSGVITGKQFPFRYWSARKAISEAKDKVYHLPIILDALEECMDIALGNTPKLLGKTMVLSDNSGSAWGALTSEYGKVCVADIDNLSAVMMAMRSEEGYVGTFGDELRVIPIVKREGILSQTEKVTKAGERVGGATENGIWIFFRDAIDKKEWYDNIVIFSDQQAGHGGLYGTIQGVKEYAERGFNCWAKGISNYGTPRYINVMDLLIEYRKKVNPKVNFMTVQTAGYENVVIPENIYRGVVAYGWTGQEIKLLDATTKIWDQWDQAEAQK